MLVVVSSLPHSHPLEHKHLTSYTGQTVQRYVRQCKKLRGVTNAKSC